MQQKSNLVSIIIPNYNSSDFIVETLESIKKQTHSNWECIIVDDWSLDDSVKVIERFIEDDSRFSFYIRPKDKPKGANSCRNYGFERSKGDYVNWFDSDDVMLPSFLEVKIQLIFQKDFVISTGCFASYDLDPDKNKKIELFESDFIFKDYVLWRLKILTPSIMFKKDFLLQYDYMFNEKIHKGQETELFSKIFYSSKPNQYAIINEATFLYRSHKNSSTNKNQNYNKLYKESETHTLVQNFERSLQLGDNDLIQSFARLLVNMLKKSVDNGHMENVKIILGEFDKTIKERNEKRVFFLRIIVKFFLLTKIRWIRWELPFKKVKINY